MDISSLFKISSGLYIIGVKNGNDFGGSVVDAFIQATSSNPPHIILCSMNGNRTTALIKENGEFTVSVLNRDIDPFIIANFGYQSSRTVNKWENVDYQLKDGLPVLIEAAAFFRCKVENIRIMSTHNIFTASVEDAWLGSGEPLLYDYYFKNLKESAAKAFAEFKATGKAPRIKFSIAEPAANAEPSNNGKTKQWVCTVCGYVYNGDTSFEDLPDDWLCPLCGAPKSLFELQWI